MGAKGRRRREKNYLAAHGGNSRLPPPPDSSSIEAIPSKLRKLMSLTDGNASIGGQEKRKGDGGRDSEKRQNRGDKLGRKVSGTRSGEDGKSQVSDPSNEVVQNSKNEKKTKKRKRKQVNDLRFAASEELVGSKRKERKKLRLEERKKKQKRNKEHENGDFPARDQVKFGEVVQAPPKLLAVPKAFKNLQDASQERLRIQAVEAYRKRKAWASRPGIQLPPAVVMSPPL
ncbi:hypothetical protein M9H77_33343 [Catharanthus roseus]|uniref:Uncharacterized protein n=1 Tax=Catharanthus roseus TaxID=4058 RepID=A0ACB9ZIX8_CATRO|nr:hypothetical protein M9H77_33343 [Catharanthus roseus]